MLHVGTRSCCTPGASHAAGQQAHLRSSSATMQRKMRLTVRAASAHEGFQKVHITFKLRKYKCEWGQTIALVGNHPELGTWDVNKGLYMSWQDNHAWSKTITISVDANLNSAASAISYKYAILTLDDGQIKSVTWQEGKNYNIHIPSKHKQVFLTVVDSWDQAVLSDVVAAHPAPGKEPEHSPSGHGASGPQQGPGPSASPASSSAAPSQGSPDTAPPVPATAAAGAASPSEPAPAPSSAAEASTSAALSPTPPDTAAAAAQAAPPPPDANRHHAPAASPSPNLVTMRTAKWAPSQPPSSGSGNGSGAVVLPKPKPLAAAPLIARPSDEQMSLDWVMMPLLVRRPHDKFGFSELPTDSQEGGQGQAVEAQAVEAEARAEEGRYSLAGLEVQEQADGGILVSLAPAAAAAAWKQSGDGAAAAAAAAGPRQGPGPSEQGAAASTSRYGVPAERSGQEGRSPQLNQALERARNMKRASGDSMSSRDEQPQQHSMASREEAPT